MNSRAQFLHVLLCGVVSLGFMGSAHALLVAHYDFEDESPYLDKSTEGAAQDDLTAEGTVTVIADAGGGLKSASNVLDLTAGNNSLFSASSADTLRPGSFSIALWIKYSASFEEQEDFSVIVNKRNNGGEEPGRNSSNYWVGQGEIGDGGINNAFRVSFDYYDDEAPTGANIPGMIQHDAEDYSELDWHHYAMVFDTDANTLEFYLDGVLKATSTDVTQEPLTDDTAYFSLGARGGGPGTPGRDWNGWLDDVRLYDHPLTSEEVATLLVQTPPELQGDFNGDGIVNLADYTVWRDTLGSTGTGLTADGNGDELVDEADYGIWKQHFGEGTQGALSTGSSVAVPEPASLTVLAVGLCILALQGHRRPT